MTSTLSMPSARGRWDVPMREVSPEQARAVVWFHQRTNGAFDRVTDLSLMGAYARERGWMDISSALLPAATEVGA